MADDNLKRKSGQAKKPFVVRETPVWLDQEQDWISAGARHLYKTLRTLADQRTGKLFIAGRGWIEIRTIERKAGMSEETRLRYQGELDRLGAIKIDRDHVIRVIDGRKRKVWGKAQFTVLPLSPNQHKQRAPTTPGCEKASTGARSTTPGIDENAKSPHVEGVSTTPGVEKNLLHPDSSGPVKSGSQYSSETTSEGGAVGSGSGDSEFISDGSCRRHESTANSDDAKSLPSANAAPKARPYPDAIPVDALTFFFSDKPKLYQWARVRILERAARTVANKSAYIKKALPEFYANLENEVEVFLQDKGIAILTCNASQKPTRATHERALSDFLTGLRDKHGLELYTPSYILISVQDFIWENWALLTSYYF